MNYLLLKLLFLLLIADPTGDLNLTDTNEVYVLVGEIIRYCIVLITLFVLFLSLRVVLLCRIRLKRGKSAVFFTLLFVFFYSLVVGFIFNAPRNVFNESLGMIPLLFIPSLLVLKPSQQMQFAKFIMNSLIVICSVKFMLAQAEGLQVYGTLSWRVLLKQSPLLILPFTYFFIKILQGDYRGKHILLFIISLVLLLSAQARALNIVVLFSTLTLFFVFRVGGAKFLMIVFLFLFAGLIQSLLTGIDPSNIFGFWSGDNYDNTVQHRVVQSAMLVERIVDHPFSGVGLGHFTLGYLGFEYLDKPYQLELDLPNFFTKIGIIVSLLYIWTYFVFAKIILVRDLRVSLYSEIAISYAILVFSCLIYSIFQTFHSSVLYWMIYSASFSFIAYRDHRVPLN